MANKVIKLHNTQAEREVLNAIMLNPYVYDYVADIISRDIFQEPESAMVYDLIIKQVREGKMIDAAEIFGILSNKGIDISHYLFDMPLASELTRQRIQYLDDLRVRTKLLAAMCKGQAMVTDTTITREQLRDITKEVDGLLDNDTADDDIQQIGEVTDMVVNDAADRKNDKGEQGLMTGLHIFDSRYGWHGGDLVILAGGTSQGKTVLATTICYNMASNAVPCVFYSLEMSAKQLTARMMARQTGVSSSATLYGKLSDDEYKQVFDGSLQLKKLPIYFDEKNKTSFPKMCSSIRRLVKRLGIKVVFIDYLQILVNGMSENRESALADIARELKRLAVDEGICICVLSQLSRSKEDKSRPRLNQMRGSGQIEEACDMAAIIHRPNLTKDSANLYLDKGRNVGVAKDIIKFNATLSYFSDYEQGDPTAPFKDKKEDLPF